MGNKRRKPKASLSPIQENRYLKLVLILVLFALLWLLFAPNTGFLALLRQRAELKTLQQETQDLTLENESLKKEIERIENDDEYLEEISRRDYGLVKENEMVFDFSPKKKKNKEEK